MKGNGLARATFFKSWEANSPADHSRWEACHFKSIFSIVMKSSNNERLYLENVAMRHNTYLCRFSKVHRQVFVFRQLRITLRLGLEDVVAPKSHDG